MPPKVKITKNDITRTAVSLIRNNGIEAFNTRNIAKELNCSTQPIFSNFTSMEELENEVILFAYNMYLDFIKNEISTDKYPKYKAFGMAYIRFAKEETQLFKLLFMRDRTDEDTSPSPDFNDSVQIIMTTNGVSEEIAKLIHLEMWTFVHGIAVILATSFTPFDWELINQMISDVYQGIRHKHVLKDC